MLNNYESILIAGLFYLLDTNVRADLSKKQIADERDYVSRLVTNFNYPFGLFNKFWLGHMKLQCKWFSRVNKPSDERRFGCDSMIVFQVENRVKIGLFEAKWCRIIDNPDYQWDSTQKASKRSHFTDQIKRQSLWTKKATIWEMFFYEQKVGKFDTPFDKNASTCVLHKYARKFIRKPRNLKTLWNNDDLLLLIESAQTPSFDGENETNLKDIIYNILYCKYGKPIEIKPTDSSIYLSSNDDSENVAIPIINFGIDDQTDQRIEGFMSENGLSFFQYLKIR